MSKRPARHSLSDRYYGDRVVTSDMSFKTKLESINIWVKSTKHHWQTNSIMGSKTWSVTFIIDNIMKQCKILKCDD